jgi:hypothetical protein
MGTISMTPETYTLNGVTVKGETGAPVKFCVYP